MDAVCAGRFREGCLCVIGTEKACFRSAQLMLSTKWAPFAFFFQRVFSACNVTDNRIGCLHGAYLDTSILLTLQHKHRACIHAKRLRLKPLSVKSNELGGFDPVVVVCTPRNLLSSLLHNSPLPKVAA